MPGTDREQRRLISSGCFFMLDSRAESGDTNIVHSERRCANMTYQTNTTLELESTNHTGNGIDPYESYATYMQSLETTPIVLIEAITIIIYSVGVIANMLLLTYIVKFRRYRSPTFALILSLGCCDAGTCACAIIFAVILMPTLIGPGWLCEFSMWITNIFFVSSVCHTILFSMLRFCQLLFPLISRAKITVSLIMRLCIFFWSISIPISVTPASFYTSASFTYRGRPYTICELKTDQQKRHISFDTAHLFIPNIIIAWFHVVKHVIVLRRSEKRVSEQEQEHRRQTTDGRAVTLVIAVFCVTSLPHVLHQYAHFLFGFPKLSFHQMLSQVDINLCYVNSAINPWIYVLAARSVRRDIMAMLKLK